MVFDRASLRFLPWDLCTRLPLLLSLDVHSNALTSLPPMRQCTELKLLNVGNNELGSLAGEPFSGLGQLRDLILAHNHIRHIPKYAFRGLGRLQYLDLQHNIINDIHPEAFVPLLSIEDLNLGENSFSELPTKGLENIWNLKTFHNNYLKDFPDPATFPQIQILTLSYAYHCCGFITQETEVSESPLKEYHEWLSNTDYNLSLWDNHSNIFSSHENLSSSYQAFAEDTWYSDLSSYSYDSFPTTYTDLKFHNPRPPIECRPKPGPFMPCDDLMGWWSLRCGVWVVFLLALLGNGSVLVVTSLSPTKLDVPRFLICNLAAADLAMGIYLGFLAIVDAATLGTFKMTAIAWQTSPGCRVAGFLGVLSSELSVFTLTVITLERLYAITHAMHLHKRLSLRHAIYVMACGWFVAGLLATMPLLGVSDYRKFAICLPFEIGDPLSLSYVCFIMLINCIAFCIIVACYMKMYCSIRGSSAWNSNDSRVAKRMALLVFTDFFCWAPISFFSLTAAFGLHLISLNDAKVFTIFVLPLNSCANPFLYAILTKQFKKDCELICKRLEESAINRSLSRFSNRNPTVTWASSRRPSALNSFLNGGEKREGRNSNSSGKTHSGSLLQSLLRIDHNRKPFRERYKSNTTVKALSSIVTWRRKRSPAAESSCTVQVKAYEETCRVPTPGPLKKSRIQSTSSAQSTKFSQVTNDDRRQSVEIANADSKQESCSFHTASNGALDLITEVSEPKQMPRVLCPSVTSRDDLDALYTGDASPSPRVTSSCVTSPRHTSSSVTSPRPTSSPVTSPRHTSPHMTSPAHSYHSNDADAITIAPRTETPSHCDAIDIAPDQEDFTAPDTIECLTSATVHAAASCQ